MIRNMRLWLIAGLMCLAPVLAGAQSDIPSGEFETLNEVAAPVAAVPVDPYADWRAVAAQAEADLQLGSASLFRLERRRADVAEWRDQFLESQSQNASRIATVESQIAALGEATDTEAASVTARREALTVQLQDLMAPVILAQEAYAQANGLVAELDVQLRARQTSVLTERSASPLEPANWTAAFTAVWAGIVASAVETNTRLGTAFASRDYIWNWLVSAAIILVGITLNVRHRRWINGLSKILEHSWPNGRPVWEFVLSSGFFVLPYMGVSGSAEVTGGPMQNMALVHTGDLAFGMTTMGPAAESIAGGNPIAPGLQMNNACAMFPMYQTPFSITALASSGITSVADIPDGARIGFGPAGSTSDTYFPRMMTELGVNYDRRNGGWSDLGGQLQDGLLDVIAFAAGVPVPAVSQLEAQVDVNIIEFTVEEQAAITAAFPVAPFDIAADAYTTLEAPARSVSMWNFAIANCDLPETFVYGVVDAVMSDNERMVNTHRAAASTLPEYWDRNTVMAWHPGAARWFIENAGAVIADDMIHGN